MTPWEIIDLIVLKFDIPFFPSKKTQFYIENKVTLWIFLLTFITIQLTCTTSSTMILN